MRILAAAVLVCACASGVARADETPPPNKDRALIQILIDAGANLSRPREFHFMVGAPDEESARRIHAKVSALGLDTDWSKRPVQNDWIVIGVKVMLPSEDELAKWRKVLSEIAAAEGGKYEGAGFSVTS